MKRILLFCLIFNFTCAYSQEFGEYKYSKYIALNQQLQNQRALALRQQMKYNSSPLRNIRYPSANNPYPNISPQKAVRVNNYRYY